MGRGNSRISTAYQKAKASGQSTYRWEGSKAKDGKNIQISWTKALENTIKHFCTVAKKVEKQAEQARLEASKNMIKAGGSQTIAVTGTMSFGEVLDALISSGIAAKTAEGLASKLISFVGSAFGTFVGVLGGTALLWWFSPIEAGESEEQATAWQKEEKKENNQHSDDVKDGEYDDLPDNAKEAYDKYDKSGWKGAVQGQTKGTKAGKKYENKNNKLPSIDENGNPITYKEWDVNNKLPGSGRDAERFVTGSDGSVYYTDSHYGEIDSPTGLPPFLRIR